MALVPCSGKALWQAQALHADPPADRTLVLRHQVETGGFGHDRQRGASPDDPAGRGVGGDGVGRRRIPEAGQRLGSGKSELLVDGRGEHDAGPAFTGPRDQSLEGGKHRGHAPLHVAGTAAIHPAIPDHRHERLDRHVVRRDGVLVGVPEDHRGTRDRGVDPGEHVVAAGSHRLAGPGQPDLREVLDEEVGHPPLEIFGAGYVPPHRIHARATHEVGEQGIEACHASTLPNRPPPCLPAARSEPPSFPGSHRHGKIRGLSECAIRRRTVRIADSSRRCLHAEPRSTPHHSSLAAGDSDRIRVDADRPRRRHG